MIVKAGVEPFPRDCGFVLASDRDNYLRLYNAKDGSFIRRFTQEPAGFHGMSFSPDGRRVLTPCERDVGAVLWDVESGSRIYRLAGNPGGISGSFSPRTEDVPFLAAGTEVSGYGDYLSDARYRRPGTNCAFRRRQEQCGHRDPYRSQKEFAVKKKETIVGRVGTE